MENLFGKNGNKVVATCGICGQGFASLDDLADHLATHKESEAVDTKALDMLNEIQELKSKLENKKAQFGLLYPKQFALNFGEKESKKGNSSEMTVDNVLGFIQILGEDDRDKLEAGLAVKNFRTETPQVYEMMEREGYDLFELALESKREHRKATKQKMQLLDMLGGIVGSFKDIDDKENEEDDEDGFNPWKL